MRRYYKFLVSGLGLVVIGLAIGSGYFKFPDQAIHGSESHLVKKVIDGDTIEIERYGRVETVRLIGVDTPETVDPRKTVQCFGKEASDYSKELMSNKSVILEPDPLVGERDKYNRLLAYVWLDDKRMVNHLLVAQGFAHEYTYRSQPYKYQQLLKDAQKQAKMQSTGLWSESSCNGKTK